MTSDRLRSTSDPVTENSVPLDFETFVPAHDAALSFMQSMPPYRHRTAPPATPTAEKEQLPDTCDGDAMNAVNADEAFSHALSAMYWCGYWTAMYHVSSPHTFHLLFGSSQEDSLL